VLELNLMMMTVNDEISIAVTPTRAINTPEHRGIPGFSPFSFSLFHFFSFFLFRAAD